MELLSEQLCSTNQKLSSSKQLAQRLSAEVDRLRSEKDLLESKMTNYSFDTSVSSTATKAEQDLINSLQSRLKMSTNSVSRQLEQIKQLRTENEKQVEKIAQQAERISHLERDLAQKRILMDDIKLKLAIAQENAEADADIMLEVEAKLKSLTDSNCRLKSQVECLKARLDSVGREKYLIESTVSKLTEEIDRKTKMVSELQRKVGDLQSRLANVEQSAEDHLRQLAMHTETAIDTAQARLTAADSRLKEYSKFIKVFAFTLLNSVRQARSLLGHQRAILTDRTGGTVTASDLATSTSQDSATAADLSASKFSKSPLSVTPSHDDLSQLEATVMTDSMLLDAQWAKRCEALLQSQVDFSFGLVKLFMEKVDERCNLSFQLSST
jgi:centlein